MNFLKDNLVASIIKNGGIYSSDLIEIHLPETFGFCRGVCKAVKITQQELKRINPKKIILLGEIIHNPTVNNYFQEQGVKIIREEDYSKIKDSLGTENTLIIPAFGVTLNTEKEILSGPCKVLDATCEDVKSIWKFVSTNASLGKTNIIYGKANHAETKGILSRAIKEECNAAVVVSSIKEAEKLAERISKNLERTDSLTVFNKKFFNPYGFALCSQTTMLYDDSLKISKIINAATKTVNADFITCKTVCQATRHRQHSAIEICKKPLDLIFVIGGYSSSNTTKLYQIAQQYNKQVFFIESADAITKSQIIHFIPELKKEERTAFPYDIGKKIKIGILAGASCPFTSVGNVIRRLKTIDD
ncbi:MAG: 4-hydroxy-3-methylbut-2-enyl diphosphate reductase [Verrucomicrobiota bacterium]|nr:4-hydroxy-3-methylbut-2-enyl diphosphate reductase [Verrucomicrobiota bacterium]